MDIKASFGLAASIFVLIGSIPYIIDIHNKRAHPHVLSWIGWSFITALGASAMMAEGATWSSAIVWANTAMCFAIALYAVVRKAGVWSTTKYDYLFFVFGFLGLILWQTLNMPVLAIVFAIFADISFGLPTIIKAYKNPNSETRLVWIASAISGTLGIFAISNFGFHEAAYPLYLFIYDFTMFLIVLRVVYKRK